MVRREVDAVIRGIRVMAHVLGSGHGVAMRQLVNAWNAEHEDGVEEDAIVEQSQDREVRVDGLVAHLLIRVEDKQGDRVAQESEDTNGRQDDASDDVFDHRVAAPLSLLPSFSCFPLLLLLFFLLLSLLLLRLLLLLSPSA